MQCHIETLSPGVDLESDQSIGWLFLQVLYPYYSNISYRLDPRVCGWVGVHISPLVVCGIPFCTKDTSLFLKTIKWLGLHVEFIFLSEN